MSRSPSPLRGAGRRPQAAVTTVSPLIALGLLVTFVTLLTLYTHTNHIMESFEHDQKFRFESTTYHSLQKKRKTHKRIHRSMDGKEVIEIVQDDEAPSRDSNNEEDSRESEPEKETPLLRSNNKDDTWPAPRLTNESTVILVLSARSHMELRQVIRETWGNGHDNVYFVIGQYCPVNQAHRKNELTCEDMPLSTHYETQKQHDDWYAKRMKLESQVLREEQDHYRDMLWTPSPESYRGLPHKLKEGYDWVITHLPNTKWIVKADDDTVVRVKSLGTYLETTLQYTKPTVIGKLEYEGIVHQEGRWKETLYPHEKYPPFPLGSCGHAVSRPVADYIAKHKSRLTEYQGEDTSVGIWMDEAPFQVEWLFSESFENDGKCENPNLFVIGHDLSVQKIRDCFAIGDEVQPISVTQF